MDERVMMVWIDEVLSPYVKKAPVGIKPLLILDAYSVHKEDSVLCAIESLGCRVEYIPGGCTSLCQPVDVGINKSLKSQLYEQHDMWLAEQPMDVPVLPKPERKDMVAWIHNACPAISETIIKNSWRHHEFGYYDKVDEVADEVEEVHHEDVDMVVMHEDDEEDMEEV
jgi:DDE superfamily endonuclease